MTATVEQTIEVQVPIETAYNQWTQLEEFPRFMEGVEEVRQLDDRRLHWVAESGGERHEWDAEIVEQHPEERAAWRNTDGKDNAGVVTFHKIDDGTTRVAVQRDFVPEGLKEKLGGALGFADRRVKGDLERLKEFVEARGQETARGAGKFAAKADGMADGTWVVDGVCEVTLETSDRSALEAFYTSALGLKVLAVDADRTWLACGSRARLGLWTPGEKEYGDEGGRHVHFALSVSPGGLDKTCVGLRDLGVEFEGPVEHSGGDRSLYCEDPAGNVLELWDFFQRGQGTNGVAALASPSG